MQRRIRLTEAHIEKYLKDEIEKIGGKCLKGNPHNQRGMPDRICIMPKGVTLYIEVKRPGLKPRPNQRLMIGEFQDMGHNAGYVNSFAMVDKLISWILNRIKSRKVLTAVGHTCTEPICPRRTMIK